MSEVKTKKEKDIFSVLSSINVGDKAKQKNKLTYLAWASAWAEVKKIYPDATYKVHEQIIDEFGNSRFWFTDGKTGWTKVSVTINGKTMTEYLSIMDYRNTPIPAEKITSVDANKSYKRCLTKCLALHGLGLYIYIGEDLPEEETEIINLKNNLKDLIKNKAQLSDKAKEKVIELCKEAEKENTPYLEEELVTGDYRNIQDKDILEKLKIKILAIRK